MPWRDGSAHERFGFNAALEHSFYPSPAGPVRRLCGMFCTQLAPELDLRATFQPRQQVELSYRLGRSAEYRLPISITCCQSSERVNSCIGSSSKAKILDSRAQ